MKPKIPKHPEKKKNPKKTPEVPALKPNHPRNKSENHMAISVLIGILI